MTQHVVVSQAERIEDLADVSFRQPVMADYEGWDLQRLGAEFDRLLAKWKALRPSATEAAERFNDELSKRGITPYDKEAFWALEKEIRAPAVKLANDAIDALTPVTETIRAAQALTIQDIAVKLRVLRFEMIGDDEETEPKDQDWDEQCINQFCDEVQKLAIARPDPLSQNIADKVQWLAAELSEALNDYENGSCSVHVHPSNYKAKSPVYIHNIEETKRRKAEIMDDVRSLAVQAGPSDPAERMTFLAKEFKRTAAEAHPELTDWQLWEAKSVNGQHIDGKHVTFFTLCGTRPS